MAEKNQNNRSDGHALLPIKLIMPNQGKRKLVTPGGPKSTPFVPVDQEFRTRLRNEVIHVRDAISHQVRRTGRRILARSDLSPLL